jgi:hypothetical protein
MDYISVLQDSIYTSIDMNLFRSRSSSSRAHIFSSELVNFPLLKFKNVDNFDQIRLKKSAIEAYPLYDRPRGNKDISSVKFYQKQIQKKKAILPVWMILKDKKYILLDGAHRIVASYIENKNNIPAYIITI